MAEPVRRSARFYDEAPLAVIEILSPGDRMKSTLERFAEHQAIGVGSTVQMDPEALVTHVFEQRNLIRRELESLPVLGQPVPFVTRELYEQLRG